MIFDKRGGGIMTVDSIEDRDIEDDDDTGGRLSSRDFYAKQAGQYPPLTTEEEASLAFRIHAGDKDARDVLVRHNLRLGLSFAYRYSFSDAGLDFADLMQAANEGLIAAAEKFDPAQGRFATYAVWWIKAVIVREFDNHSQDIRIPTYVREWRRKLNRVRRSLEQRLGRRATEKEVLDEVNLSNQDIEEVAQSYQLHDSDFPQTGVSFDAPLADEDDRSLHDVVQGTNGHQGPEVLVLARDELKMLIDDIQRILDVLRTSPKADQWLRLFIARYNIYSGEGLECRAVPVPARGSAKPGLQSMWRYLNTQGIEGNDSAFASRIKRAQYIESVIGIRSVFMPNTS